MKGPFWHLDEVQAKSKSIIAKVQAKSKSIIAKVQTKSKSIIAEVQEKSKSSKAKVQANSKAQPIFLTTEGSSTMGGGSSSQSMGDMNFTSNNWSYVLD